MRRLCHVGNGSQEMWPNQLLFVTQRRKRARTNKGILPVFPKCQNKLPFKAPEMQRPWNRHARKTVTRPAAGIYSEPRRVGSQELNLSFAITSREGVGHWASYGSQAQHGTLSSANSKQGAQADIQGSAEFPQPH